MTKSFPLSVVLLLLLSGVALAQDAKPNFSGRWTLDVAKSEFGGMPAPESQVETIDHQEPVLKLVAVSKTPEGEQRYEGAYTTDGKDNVNHAGNVEIKSKSHWQEKTLVIESQIEYEGKALTITDVWELSEDGKMMVHMRDFRSADGTATQRLVFIKD